jgi:hypothetical protein
VPHEKVGRNTDNGDDMKHEEVRFI